MPTTPRTDDLPDEYYPPEDAEKISNGLEPKRLECMHNDCDEVVTHTLTSCQEKLTFCKAHYREVRQLMALQAHCPGCGKYARMCWEVAAA